MLPTLDEIRQHFHLDDWSDSDLVREFSRVTGMEEGRAAEAFDLKVNEPGFMTSLKQPFGGWAESAGRAAADFIPGVEEGNALQNWGEDVQFQNPLPIQSLAEIPERPWEAVKQGVAQGLGYTAQYLGQDLLGKAIGGVGGAMLGGPAGAVTGAAAGGAVQRALSLGGKALQLTGKAISSKPALIAGAGLPSYAGIRESQGSDEWWDKLVALAGSGAVGTIEVAFGVQPRLAKMLAGATTPEAKRAALEAVRQEMLSTTPLRAGLKEGAKVIGGEALEETAQTPIEQVAGYQNPLEPKQLEETAFGTAMGAIGALPFGGAYGTQRYMQRSAMGPQETAAAGYNDLAGLEAAPPPDLTTPEGRQAAINATQTPEEVMVERDQTVEAIKREARAELERLGLQDIETVVVDRLFTPKGAEVDADYGGKVLRVALDTAPEERANVINHEVVHALKELGLFKPKEWWVLERSAELSFKKNKQRMQQYIEAYGLGPLADLKQMDPVARAKLLEEAIADMNRDYKAGLLKPASGLRGLLDRLNNFLEATGNTLRGLGFQSSRDVLERIQRGEVGRRAAGEAVAPEGRAFNIRQQQTPEFKSWFGNGVVAEPTGAPRVVYHGTYAGEDFSTFGQFSHFGTQQQAHSRIYSKSGSVSDDVAAELPLRIMPVYINLRNPLVVEDADHGSTRDLIRTEMPSRPYKGWLDPRFWAYELFKATGKHEGWIPSDIRSLKVSNFVKAFDKLVKTGFTEQQALIMLLQKKGYDGAQYYNVFEGPGESYITFSPTQVKSAVGNTGTFNPRSPDIRYSLRRQPTLPLAEQPQPEFYSAVQEAIQLTPKDSYTGNEWLQLLTPKTGKATAHPANVAGVRQEELEWNGLRQLLGSLQNEQVSKKDLLEQAALAQPNVTFRGGWADDPNSGIEWGYWQDAMTEPGSRWRTPELGRVGIRQASSDYIGELPGGFAVGHFSHVPNNIGWYRFGELTLPDGRRLLFIDEVQSDWQQRYRSTVTREMIEENRKLDPSVRKELPQPMVDLRAENYDAKPGETKGPGAYGVLQLLRSNRLVEQQMLLEWQNNNNYRTESPELVSRSWWRNWILERLLGNMSWNNTDLHSTTPEQVRALVEQAMELADRMLPALQETWARTGGAASAKPKPGIPFNFEYRYILGSSNPRDQARILEVTKANLRRLVEAHIKSQFGRAQGWDIIYRDGTVVERGYLPQDNGSGMRPGGARSIVESWLEQERYAMTGGMDTPRRGPAGPWVRSRNSFARVMLMDALHFAAKNGMDGVVIIPGLDQAIRNSKTIEDPVVGIYDKGLQEDLRKAAKELGGAPELQVEYRRGARTFERDTNMEASTWGASFRPMTHQQRRNVLTIAEQLITEQSTGTSITPEIIVAAQNSISLIRQRLDQNSGSVYNYISDPREGLAKMIIESDVDSALMPLGNQITEEQRPLVHKLVFSAIRKASDSVWNAGEQNRQAIGGLEAAARPLDAEIVLRGLIEQIDAIAMNRAVQIRPDIASLGLTAETAKILRNALYDMPRYLQRANRADAVVFTQEVLVRFRGALASALTSSHTYDVTHPGVADALLRKGEVALLSTMKEAGANSRRMDQPRVAKGVQMTPALAEKMGTGGARLFSVRRRTAQQTSANPAQAARVFESMNRIFGTGLDATNMGKVTARFNGFMKAMLTLPQVERENWTVPGVMQFTNAVRSWWATKGKWTAEWDKWVDEVRRSGYGKAELSALWRFANEVTLRSDELGRHLTPTELADEARKVGGLDAGLLDLWTKGRKILQDALDELEDLAMARAASVWTPQNDPAGEQLREVQDEITKDFQTMRNRDYWPLARFGTYTVHVVAKVPLRHEGRDFKPGDTMRFELYETESEQLQRKRQLLAAHPGKLEVSAGRVDESLYSFQGLPPSMLKMIERELMESAQEFLTGDQAVDADTMEMVKKQLDAIRIAMLHFSPENAFKQRMLRRKGTRGFTDDGLRAMAQLGQAFAGHIARAKHRGEMDEALKVLHQHRKGVERTEDPTMLGEGNKLGDLYNYLRGTQKYVNNPGNDLANLRAAGFLWHLAFVPRAALVQVAQPLFTTYPWLASRYGDARAVAEMGRGYKLIRRMLKEDWRAKDAQGKPLFRADLEAALIRGMDAGILNQSLFTELAGLAEGSNLQRLMPGKFLKSQRAASMIRKAGYYGSFLFQKGEEVNRLVSFRAAYELEVRKLLGLEGGTSDQVGVALLAKTVEERQQIIDLGYLAARSATEITQGEYSRWARPTIMRGKMSAVLLFKMYPQIMTYFAARDPGALRFMAIQLAIAGALGLPFAGDLLDLAKALCNAAGGTDCNLEHMVREYVQELGVNPELAMHGLARVTTPWDFSASMSLGQIVPALGPVMESTTPGADFRSMASRAQEEALGALFSIPLKWMQAVSTGNERDIEQAMPTIVRDVYRTYRRFREGGEQSRSGAMMADIDWSDPMDVVTHLGQAAGLRPVEVAQAAEVSWAQKEAGRYWAGRREAIVGQYYHLYKSGARPDREAVADVMAAVREFNASVPFPEMGISGVQLKKGLKLHLQRRAAAEQGMAPEKKYRRLYSEIAEGFEPAY